MMLATGRTSAARRLTADPSLSATGAAATKHVLLPPSRRRETRCVQPPAKPPAQCPLNRRLIPSQSLAGNALCRWRLFVSCCRRRAVRMRGATPIQSLTQIPPSRRRQFHFVAGAVPQPFCQSLPPSSCARACQAAPAAGRRSSSAAARGATPLATAAAAAPLRASSTCRVGRGSWRHQMDGLEYLLQDALCNAQQSVPEFLSAQPFMTCAMYHFRRRILRNSQRICPCT